MSVTTYTFVQTHSSLPFFLLLFFNEVLYLYEVLVSISRSFTSIHAFRLCHIYGRMLGDQGRLYGLGDPQELSI